ncbi:hypothetical protein [Streptomyces apocyni]|uniref:hypothetical protein n=1 Tax=Streptomyces apocyni TaxID=2654677 RepID=UPI0012EA0089|nr:hypothetical protein [Streptomyces apocyni]
MNTGIPGGADLHTLMLGSVGLEVTARSRLPVVVVVVRGTGWDTRHVAHTASRHVHGPVVIVPRGGRNGEET